MAKKKEYWFKAKTYGWGWYPSTWQGWAVTIAFTALIVASASLMLLPLTMLFVIGLIAVCFKTGEKPSWHWGNKKSSGKKK